MWVSTIMLEWAMRVASASTSIDVSAGSGLQAAATSKLARQRILGIIGDILLVRKVEDCNNREDPMVQRFGQFFNKEPAQ